MYIRVYTTKVSISFHPPPLPCKKLVPWYVMQCCRSEMNYAGSRSYLYVILDPDPDPTFHVFPHPYPDPSLKLDQTTNKKPELDQEVER
jgi:hypothetical protein